MYRPEQLTTTLDDVVGIDQVKEDVSAPLNLLPGPQDLPDEMGGSPRRGLLFEGAPGTGKTHLARAMAREAGVPFLFVSATSFQSMWYGATAKRIRSYFKALRKAARKEGGAIGFIEEIDAIGMARGGVASGMTGLSVAGAALSGCHGTACLPSSYASVASGATVQTAFTSEGTGGVVNELLVQMQSFDDPTGGQRLRGWFVDRVNLLLPPDRQLQRPVVVPSNLLLIAATNRAEGLDPALLRPGRFDRRITFEVPVKAGRRTLLDHFLAKKAHAPELDDPALRDALAAVTQGYTPVMIEHLLDEALVNAVRRGDTALTHADVERARLVEEVGMGQPVAYTDHERRLIATHEAGHATMAWLTAPERRLEVLTIVKRARLARPARARRPRGRLHPLAHRDARARRRSPCRPVRRGDLLRRRLDRPGGDLLYATNAAAEMVGRARHGRSLLSYAAIATARSPTPTSSGGCSPTTAGRDAVERCCRSSSARRRRCSSDTATSSRRCATRCSSARSWSAPRSPTSSRRPRRARVVDLTDAGRRR
jgi:AAA+ superfamily predicted ATPase